MSIVEEFLGTFNFLKSQSLMSIENHSCRNEKYYYLCLKEISKLFFQVANNLFNIIKKKKKILNGSWNLWTINKIQKLIFFSLWGVRTDMQHLRIQITTFNQEFLKTILCFRLFFHFSSISPFISSLQLFIHFKLPSFSCLSFVI